MTSITLTDLKDCDTRTALSKLAVRYHRYVSIHLARLTKLSEEAGLEAFIAIKLIKTLTSQNCVKLFKSAYISDRQNVSPLSAYHCIRTVSLRSINSLEQTKQAVSLRGLY
jgi:hypothetical protein